MPNSCRLQAWDRNSRSLGPGDADVGEAALLLQLVGLGERTDVREDALLHADQEHDRELQALGRVQRHQHDLVVVVVELVGVGDQRDLLEELVEPGELAGRADQLAEVLDPAGRLDRVLGLQLGEVAAVVERRLQQVAGRRRSSAASTPRSSSSSTNDAMPRAAGPVTPGFVGAPQRLDEARRPSPAASASSLATLTSPTPRLGTLSTRLTLTSSAGLTTARR